MKAAKPEEVSPLFFFREQPPFLLLPSRNRSPSRACAGKLLGLRTGAGAWALHAGKIRICKLHADFFGQLDISRKKLELPEVAGERPSMFCNVQVDYLPA